MKSIFKKSREKAAFTIIELLTVMSIIVILIGLLVPALNMAKRYAKMVRQKAQFHAMDAAIELYSNEFDGYPPSGAMDPTGQAFCGAMKLCETMMGQDLMGLHTSSVFRRDGMDSTGTRLLYPTPPSADNLKARKGPYLPSESVSAYRLARIYDDPGPFLPESFVLCDVYTRQMRTGEKIGMPILYYKANTANSLHDPNTAPTRADSKGNIYNYWDNQDLIALGKPWEAGELSAHKLLDPVRFYRNTRSDKITTTSRPFRVDSYILISAGFDGEYGTADDVCNFEWKYRE